MDHMQVQCPVCTLYLRNGMTLESHLDTHPKDQVIKALCCLTTKGNSFGSRTPTPLNSDRSYRSRSRTPAGDDRWNGVHQSGEHDKYWRRPPSRTPKSTPVTSVSGSGTPEIRMADMQFEGSSLISGQNSLPSYTMKSDKTQQTYQSTPMSDFDPSYSFYQDQPEDREIKYSRSAEYTAMDNSNMFTYNMPTMAAGVRFQANTSLLPTVSKKTPDFVKILPKPSNIVVKTNVGGVQYIASGVKPMHVMMPPTPAFVQKNMQNNMIMPSNNHTSLNMDKAIPPQLNPNPFNHLSTGNFPPGMSTVMTQNSQIIYREMVHNIDGKPFISSVPAVITTGSGATLAQAGPMYQNVMVVDQFGSCMYTTPQNLLNKSCTTSIYSDSATLIPTSHVAKSPTPSDPKTLVIEVGPILPSQSASPCVAPSTSVSTSETMIKTDKDVIERSDSKVDTSSSTKGLKILSNIKVEVPVQHNKNMVNTIMDLTESNDQEYPGGEMDCSISSEKALPDINGKQSSENCTPRPSCSSNDSASSHSFSVIKNIGNPLNYKGPSGKTLDSKLDTEYSDSCPVPDLICNEKPSISPCSELSENGENSTDRTSLSPKLGRDRQTKLKAETVENKNQVSVKPYRLNALRLNNLYVKKNKKVLQIKNAKQFATGSSSNMEIEPMPSSSRSPEDYSIKKHVDSSEFREPSTLQTVSVEEIKENDENYDTNGFDADTEHSLDMEPPPPLPAVTTTPEFSTTVDMVHVKEEISTSNESAFCNSATPDRVLTPMETLRPVNVIAYGNIPADNFDEESSHRELMNIEAASKSKQFVSMMNENYFGENLYADYFAQDRGEAYENRQPAAPKEPLYGMWGESSQKDNEFVLPSFIHDTYKMPDSGACAYSEIGGREGIADGDGDGCERDSKADVLSEGRSEGETPLNICADERMPPRGELSGQESNGDMESAWNGMYPDVPPSEPYDLMARESWVSDGSDVDVGEKRETLEEEIQYPKPRTYSCAQCNVKFPTPKELRAHRAQAHAAAAAKTSYSRMITARAIKKEEKTDDNMMGCTMIDSKESITTSILQVYEMEETKTKIEGIIKQETKRRRKDFVCPTCKVDQLTDAAFHAHLKIHPLECLTCGKCFYRRANLALHIKTHLGIKNYKCDVCEKRFITRQKLSEHHNVHTGRAPVKCTVCDDTFRRYSNMVQHRDRHHFGKRARVRDFVCQCGAVFHSRAKLLWHQETHEERPKACLYCSDKFVHAASLTRHVRRAHNEYYLAPRTRPPAPDNVPCPVCKQIYLRTNLRSHLQTHSGKRPYMCIVCNKGFTTKWNLKLHRWTHMSRSSKPFKCHLCKGAFIRQTEYISHMNAHKSVRPYTCNYCGCQFIRKYNCQRHVREHEMAKKYVCKVPECGKSFHRSYYLSEHMKVHSGARPFACNICGKTSSNKSNHNKHVKIHHAREPVATEA
ncbi:uncharacterized protein LOC115451564 [Manduca sexta]|uniref:uncharacterized protein LOC115451564 n=1 Tax=Manduca sexta TaxID=7130 RepID=UPI00188F0089|nr:uncharacterized protein LOC115451564 [Manduca sexta]